MMKKPFKSKDENLTNIEMSIQVSLNGLSFCMLDQNQNELLFYKKQNFKKTLTPSEVLQQIKLVYSKEQKLLTQKVDRVIVLFANNLYTLVPHIFFKEENAPDYLKYNAKILQTDFVSHDIVSKPQMVNIYIPYANVSNYFFDLYGEFEYKHSVSVFLEGIFNFEKTSGCKMYVNVQHGSFDLAVLDNAKLLLCNSFEYQTKEDFIYYILFTAEQLKLSAEEFELQFFGAIEKDSELYKIAYTYVRNVKLYEAETPFTTAQQPINAAEEFILLQSLLNEDSIRNT